jgi:hypothetical protein
MIYSSKTTRSFYDPAIHDVMPDDVIELPEGLHRELMDGQVAGKVIDWRKNGMPYLRNPTAPTVEELNAQAIVQRESAYKLEADPLFFQDQRDEVKKQVWLDKIVEIKARYPKQEA